MTQVTIAPLVETAWLQEHLDDADLRIFDCSVTLPPPGASDRRPISGHATWEAGHIPGSAFADLIEDLSDPSNTRYSFPFPPEDQFVRVMSRLGVDDSTRVVLYDQGASMWAARLWWLLRAYGFDQAGVLNGGWQKWTREGRPVSTEPASYPPATFVARPRPELIVNKEEVLAAIGDPDQVIVNALTPDAHYGRSQPRHGRPGHIKSSVNVPAMGPDSIQDPDTSTYIALDQIRAKFEQVGALNKERVITYCGGGIAASSAALALHLIGVDNIALYDGSLSEWSNDTDLPMETE
jgi:thiosulfate/3-mercaptopyruvate sulfurtransferase